MNRHGIHYAQLENSPRLKRLLKFLSDGRPHTTREIVHGAEIMAVSTAVDELRENGFEIECHSVRKGVYEYQMKSNEQKITNNQQLTTNNEQRAMSNDTDERVDMELFPLY